MQMKGWLLHFTVAIAVFAGAAIAQDRVKPGVVQATEFQLVDADGAVVGRWFVRTDGTPSFEGRQPTPSPGAGEPKSPPEVPETPTPSRSFKSAAVLPTDGTIAVRHNKFSGATTLGMKEYPVSTEVTLYVYFVTVGDRVDQPKSLSLQFIRVGEDWRWLKFSRFTMLIGGERLSASPEVTTDTLRSGRCMESLSVNLPFDQAVAIAEGGECEVQIGVDEFSLGVPFRVKLAALLNTIGAAVPQK